MQRVPVQRAEAVPAAIAAAHQRIAPVHQSPHAGAQGAIGVPVGGDSIDAEQPFGHVAQGRAREGAVERRSVFNSSSAAGAGRDRAVPAGAASPAAASLSSSAASA